MPVDDAHPDARRVPLERLRGMTDEERLAMVVELTAKATRLSRQAIREAMPGAPEHEVILRWIEQEYGADLAARVAPNAERLGRES